MRDPENTHYPRSLDNSITARVGGDVGVLPPDHRTSCANVFDYLNTSTVTTRLTSTFWNDHDYAQDVSKVKAAVFESHSIDDDNVARTRSAGGPASPPTTSAQAVAVAGGSRRPVRVPPHRVGNTLHAGSTTGCRACRTASWTEPRVDIETSADTFTTYADWPIRTRRPPTSTSAAARRRVRLAPLSSGGTTTASFTDNSPSRTTRSPAQRLAGEPPRRPDAEAQERPASPGSRIDSRPRSRPRRATWRRCRGLRPATHAGRGGSDGVTNTKPTDLLGRFDRRRRRVLLEVTKPTQAVTQWRVSKGILDSSNRDSLIAGQATRHAGPEVRVQVPHPADGLQRSGGPSDRRGPAGQLLDGRRRHHQGRRHRRHEGLVRSRCRSRAEPDAAHGLRRVRRRHDGPGHRPGAGRAAQTTDLTGTNVNYTPPTATDTQDAAPAVTCYKASGTKVRRRRHHGHLHRDRRQRQHRDDRCSTVAVTCVTTATGDTTGTVPATLSLTLGTPPRSGRSPLASPRTTTASTTANVISTAGDASPTMSPSRARRSPPLRRPPDQRRVLAAVGRCRSPSRRRPGPRRSPTTR